MVSGAHPLAQAAAVVGEAREITLNTPADGAFRTQEWWGTKKAGELVEVAETA